MDTMDTELLNEEDMEIVGKVMDEIKDEKRKRKIEEKIEARIEQVARNMRIRTLFLDEDEPLQPHTINKLHDDCIAYFIAYYAQKNKQRGSIYEFFKKDVQKFLEDVEKEVDNEWGKSDVEYE